jgi:hypothetical protein
MRSIELVHFKRGTFLELYNCPLSSCELDKWGVTGDKKTRCYAWHVASYPVINGLDKTPIDQLRGCVDRLRGTRSAKGAANDISMVMSNL